MFYNEDIVFFNYFFDYVVKSGFLLNFYEVIFFNSSFLLVDIIFWFEIFFYLYIYFGINEFFLIIFKCFNVVKFFIFGGVKFI